MKYNFIGYGSLVDHNSLRESIKDKKFQLVKVKGYKRIFNLSLNFDKNNDVLNIQKSKAGIFNAVLFSVNEEELKQLKKREEDYNFEKVVVYDFASNKKIGLAMIDIDYIVSIDKKHKLPGKKYFILCRNAAYKISEEFGRFWDKTTYISNNERVDKWIKKHKDFDTIKE